jgi:hypothetical protein
VRLDDDQDGDEVGHDAGHRHGHVVVDADRHGLDHIDDINNDQCHDVDDNL